MTKPAHVELKPVADNDKGIPTRILLLLEGVEKPLNQWKVIERKIFIYWPNDSTTREIDPLTGKWTIDPETGKEKQVTKAYRDDGKFVYYAVDNNSGKRFRYLVSGRLATRRKCLDRSGASATAFVFLA
jgi:hypothetical protein